MKDINELQERLKEWKELTERTRWYGNGWRGAGEVIQWDVYTGPMIKHRAAHPPLRLRSLSWASEIAACEYLYTPKFSSKGKEAEQNWFLCVDPPRAETQLKKKPRLETK